MSAICNLSQKIKEAGIEIGKREMIMKMCDKGYTIAQIADVAGMDEKQIEDTIKMLNCFRYFILFSVSNCFYFYQVQFLT